VSKLDGFCFQQKKIFIFLKLQDSTEPAWGKDFAGFTVSIMNSRYILIPMKPFAVAIFGRCKLEYRLGKLFVGVCS
jgi:hypothetical protein